MSFIATKEVSDTAHDRVTPPSGTATGGDQEPAPELRTQPSAERYRRQHGHWGRKERDSGAGYHGQKGALT